MKPAPIRIWLGVLAAMLLVAAGVWIGRSAGKPAPAASASLPAVAAPLSAAGESSAISLVAGLAETAQTTPAQTSALRQELETSAVAQAQDQINATALGNYFKSMNDANSATYDVKAGENLTRIAKQFGVTPGLIQAANFLKNDRIFPGQKLKVPKARWSLLADKSQNTLYLKADEAVIRNYRIATGKDQSTPTGTFKILNHLKNPTWYYEGKVVPPNSPDNPLGTRWMGFDKEGYGLHGTSKPEEIGQFATLGCIRMLNGDIEPLFEILPDGTEVTVID